MYISAILLIIIYTMIIIYIFFRYNHDAKPTELYDIYREELEISATEAAYLDNKNCNIINLILADILTLVDKKYIEMQVKENEDKREYIFIKAENEDFTNIKNHEMMSYNLFFDNNNKEVCLREYLERISMDNDAIEKLEIKMLTMKRALDMELQNKGIIEEFSEKKLFRINKISLTLILSFIILGLYTAIVGNKEFMEFSYLGFLFSILLYKSTTLAEEKLTIYGANMLEKVKAYKKYLKQYLTANDKPLYMMNVLEHHYIMAVAFGMAKLGEKEFIEQTYRKTKRNGKSLIVIIIIIISIIVLGTKR